MSAFVFAAPHIRALTNFAFAYGEEDQASFTDQLRTGETVRDGFGRLLLEENARSVRTLYGEDGAADLIGTEPIAFDAGPDAVPLHDPLTILQACQRYDFQACESPDYASSWAAAAIGRVRKAACAELLKDMRLPDRMSSWPIRTDSPDGGSGLAPRYHPRASDLTDVALESAAAADTSVIAVIAVVLEGGLVQAICASRPFPGVRFDVIDYDVEGADPDDLTGVPFVDGTTTAAFRRVEDLSTPSDIDWSRFDAGPV